MKHWTLVVAVVVIGICQPPASANCPAGYTNEIFCDDFDTYCPGGGYPGDPKCPANSDFNNTLLRSVWPRTSTNGTSGALCGVEVKGEDAETLINSEPLGCRYPKGDLGQATMRDWVLSPPLGSPGQVLDIHRFVGNVFGSQYAAVIGTDDAPLQMEFFMAADVGKLFYSSGYMELGYGLPTEPLNRANTDYVNGPACNTGCDPPINDQPLPTPIMCAQSSPMQPMPAGCPSAATAPVRHAIAIGALSLTDTVPCHCNESVNHVATNYHLSLFDGRVWWVLRSNNPAPSTGTVTPRDNAPPDPADIVAGDFALSSPTGHKSYNLVQLTIKANTLKVEFSTLLVSSSGYEYDVYNVMDNIPLQYQGPFDRISMGVGPGCELESNAAWDTCKSGTDRGCLPQRNTWFVDFDDFVLHGGLGFRVEGACCLSDGNCDDTVTASGCADLGGTFRGANTVCGEGNEACLGACCMGINGCVETLNNGCSGDFQAYGSTCADGCPCPDPFADVDVDGDVDQLDFAVLQACFGGPGVIVSGTCKCFDREPVPYPGAGADGDIDGYDLAKFELCASGPSIPLNPACDTW